MSDIEEKHHGTSPADPEKEGAKPARTEDDQEVDREVEGAMEQAGTGRYTSREAADPELEAEQEESDQAMSERMGRSGDA